MFPLRRIAGCVRNANLVGAPITRRITTHRVTVRRKMVDRVRGGLFRGVGPLRG